MRKYFILCFLTLLLHLSGATEKGKQAYLDLTPKNESEALFLRRIIEFWEENSYELVESQIIQFVEEFPQSELCDPFYALLGDLYVYQNNPEKALLAYDQVVSSDIQGQILLVRLRCLNSLNHYKELTDIANPYIEAQKYPTEVFEELLYLTANSYYHLSKQSESDLLVSYAKKGIELYEKLLNIDPENDEVLVPLAYLHYELDDFPRAADLYLVASRKFSDEELLFQAASLQVKYNKELAIQTFSQISRVGKKHVSESAWNRLILLFETKKFGDIILAKNQLDRQIPEEKQTLLKYFLGRSYFELQDYTRCKQELVSFLDQSNEVNEELKQTYLTLIECARLEEDLATFDQYFSKLQEKFAASKEVGEALLVRALLHRKKHYFQEAKKDFQTILAKYPETGDKDLLEYEYARTLFEVENWILSRKTFKQFLENYEEHPYKKTAWKFFIQSSMNHAKHEFAKDSFAKDQLAFDLEIVLEQKDLFNEKQRDQYEFLLAKTNYEIQAYEETIQLVKKFLEKPHSPEMQSDAILLLALSYKNGSNDLLLFCDHAEKALRGPISIMEENLVHLELYNAYLILSGESSKKEDEYLSQAAEHLYLAVQLGANVSQENLIWLVDYFLTLHEKTNSQTFLVRSKEVLEKIFFKEQNLVQFNKNNLALESYVLKLVHIYESLGEYDKSKELLVQFHSQQTKNLDLEWKTGEETTYLLGEKSMNEDKKKALKYFEEILSKSQHAISTPFVAKAYLWHARINFELIDPTNRTIQNKTIQGILEKLKTLTIQRNLEQEPTHLEAAFDYVEIKSMLAPTDQRLDAKLELLDKTIQSFESTQDLLSKDYHARRKQLPKKDLLFSLYMKFFEAESCFCKSQLAKKNNHKEDEKIYEDRAMRAFSELDVESGLTKYLRQKIDDRLRQL